MAILKLQLLLLVVLSLGQLSLCQPDCTQLDVDFDGAAFADNNLPVCTQINNETLQCCTREYIECIVEEVEEELLDGLRDELDDTVEEFEEIVQRLIEYMATDFGDEYFSRIPFNDLIGNRDAINNQLNMFVQSFEFAGEDTFDIRNFVRGFFGAFVDLVSEALADGDSTVQECTATAITRQISDDAIRAIVAEFNRIRQSIMKSIEILEFLKDFNNTLGSFEPLSACINGLVRPSFCRRCTERVPPLCRNVCGAIVRGCFAGFRDGVGRVFDRRLWNIARQLIQFTDASIMELCCLVPSSIVGSNNALGQQLLELTSCGVDVSGLLLIDDDDDGDDEASEGTTTGGRDDDDYNYMFLGDIAEELNELTRIGVFNYGQNGPEFCQKNDRSNGGFCDDDEICTANRNCWDGEMERTRDIPRFTGDSIADQASNPVIQFDPVELQTQAAALVQQVDAFVEGDDFASGAPEGLVIPSGEDEDDSGGVVAMAPVAAVLLTVLVALILQ